MIQYLSMVLQRKTNVIQIYRLRKEKRGIFDN